MLIDSHCHLDFEVLANDRAGVLARAKAAGVTRHGDDLDPGEALRRDHRDRRGASRGLVLGRHASAPRPRRARHRRPPISCGSAQHPRCVAIGEAGLDYHYEGDYAAQATGFRRHIAAARETGLPLVIHSRSADDDTAKILEEETAGQGAFPFVLHCFSAGPDLARRGLALGGYISFSGILTFKNADGNPGDRGRRRPPTASSSKPMRRISRRCRIAGRANEPAYVRHTAEKLAELRGVSLEEIGAPDHREFRAAVQQDRAQPWLRPSASSRRSWAAARRAACRASAATGASAIPPTRKNRRRRCSLLIEGSTAGSERDHAVVIDTGCDLREQLLDANVDRVDAVLYTHEHADHTHGIDDLRVLALNNRKRVDVYFSRGSRASGSCRALPIASRRRRAAAIRRSSTST